MEHSEKSSAPALERGLSILEALARSRGGLSLSQITRYLSLPKSSVFCLLKTLEQCGYIFRNPDSGKYTVSLRISSLANLALGGTNLRDQARPFLRRLCEETKLTVHMAILEHGSCVLIEKITPTGNPPVASWIGKRLSLHCTAVGKAVAAYLPEDQLMNILQEHGLLRHNENTICSVKKLRQDLELVRQRRYSLDDQEEEISVRCIGVPLFEGQTAIGALSLVGSVNEIHSETLESLSLNLIRTASKISERIHLPDAQVTMIPAPLRLHQDSNAA